MSRKIVSLLNRALLSLKGKDTESFLQGLITNDIGRITEKNVLYTLLLNPKGRVVQDLILFKNYDEILLECDAKEKDSLANLLKRYVMHKKVSVEPNDSKVYFVDEIGDGAISDPRVPSFGGRLIAKDLPAGQEMELSFYHSRRYEFGIPEGVAEMAEGLPLFRNADLMNGISATKGCYVGQETSAVALNAGRVRQRTMPFTCKGVVSGKVAKEDGEQIGTILACDGQRGLASIKLTSLKFPVQLNAENGQLSVFIPSWWPVNPMRPNRPECA